MDMTKEEGAHWTRERQLALIQSRCAQANPEVVIDEIGHEQGEQAPEIERVFRTIRLSDVLLAIDKNLGLVRVNQDTLRISFGEGYGFWNLRKDDLQEQSDETITFLAETLK